MWMRQVARNLIDDSSGLLKGKRFLIFVADSARMGSLHSLFLCPKNISLRIGFPFDTIANIISILSLIENPFAA